MCCRAATHCFTERKGLVCEYEGIINLLVVVQRTTLSIVILVEGGVSAAVEAVEAERVAEAQRIYANWMLLEQVLNLSLIHISPAQAPRFTPISTRQSTILRSTQLSLPPRVHSTRSRSSQPSRLASRYSARSRWQIPLLTARRSSTPRWLAVSIWYR